MPEPIMLRSAQPPAPGPTPKGGGSGPPAPGPSDDGGRGRPEGLPILLAIVLVVLIAAALTYIGMQTQIWANIAESQLPGA